MNKKASNLLICKSQIISNQTLKELQGHKVVPEKIHRIVQCIQQRIAHIWLKKIGYKQTVKLKGTKQK